MQTSPFNQPPQEPHNVFTHQDNLHSFTRRTISWFFTIGVIILFVGLAMGWGFGGVGQDETAPQSGNMPAVMATSGAPQQSGGVPETGAGSWADSLRNFVKDLTGSAKDALSSGAASVAGGTQDMASSVASVVGGAAAGSSAQGGATIVQGQDDGIQAIGSGEPLTEVVQVTDSAAEQAVIVDGDTKAALATAQAVKEQGIEAIVENPEQALPPEYFKGKIVDFEGKPAGDIKAIIRNQGGGRSFFFTLDQSLTPANKPREFQVAYDEVEIIEENGSAYVKLNKAQTEAIAKALFTTRP